MSKTSKKGTDEKTAKETAAAADGENAADGKNAAGNTADNVAADAAGNTAGNAAGNTAGNAAADAGGQDTPDVQGDAEGQGAGEAGDAAPSPQEELAAERDRYLRLAAEYDNYRKRSVKERDNTYSDARADAITRLLPVFDNLERALKMECADEAFYKGVEMTMNQLIEIMEGMGVKQIPAEGEPFDPNLHDAVLTIENPELGEKIVAEECRKGFMIGDRIIRHSTVVVAN